MNYICTWFCADEKGEESKFPQTGQKSSSQSHQDIYWRCMIVFYITSRRFNKNEKHLLFTNVKQVPVVDGRPVSDTLRDLGVEVIFTDFKYKTPKGYFGMFQNQFYEFSIIEYIAQNGTNPSDLYLIVDSDCLFLRPAASLFEEAEEQGFLSFEDDCTTDLVIHGLSRKNMKSLYEDLLQKEVPEIPGYHLGEFYLCSLRNTQKIYADFLKLWPVLLDRFAKGLPKFNEEAHTLSFIYYKNGFIASPRRDLMKRIWTNPLFYRNTDVSDAILTLWHLPAEKTYGIARLYQSFIEKSENYGYELSDEQYHAYVQNELGIPFMSIRMKLDYYVKSYYRALKKRVKIKSPVRKAAML